MYGHWMFVYLVFRTSREHRKETSPSYRRRRAGDKASDEHRHDRRRNDRWQVRDQGAELSARPTPPPTLNWSVRLGQLSWLRPTVVLSIPTNASPRLSLQHRSLQNSRRSLVRIFWVNRQNRTKLANPWLLSPTPWKWKQARKRKTGLTLSLPSSKSTFSQPFIEKCISDTARIW